MILTTIDKYNLVNGGESVTVDFQYAPLPDPGSSKVARKVVQYIGESTKDPLCPEAFRGDFVHSYYDDDPESETYETWQWEVLMHTGQIIEVDTMYDSNWKPKKDFLGYRVYLTKPWDQEDTDPESPTYGEIIKHWTRGWYQVFEILQPDGTSYPKARYEWVRVLDEPNNSYVDQAWLEYSKTNEGKKEGALSTLSIITEEDQCTVKLKAEYSEAYLRNNPTEDFHEEVLWNVPLPVKAARHRYDVTTLSPYLAANFEVEVVPDYNYYLEEDPVFIPTSATGVGDGKKNIDWFATQEEADEAGVSVKGYQLTKADIDKLDFRDFNGHKVINDVVYYASYNTIYIPSDKSNMGGKVLGTDWSKTYVEPDPEVEGDKGFTKAYNSYTAAELTYIASQPRYKSRYGVLRIPVGAIPVSSLDIDITYDFDNTNFGPQDDNR